jgi:hypothetical protein
MAKTDLLKEAIADARAVKETAIANAKLALEEAFAPRIQSMLSTKLSEQLDDEEMDDELEMDMDDMVDGDMGDEMGGETPDMVGVAVDLDNDGDYDLSGEIGEEPVEDELVDMEDEMGDEEMEAEYAEADMEEGRYNEADMDLDEIIRELEEGMGEEDEMEVEEQVVDSAGDDGDGMIEEDIDAIIETILSEEEATDLVTKEEKVDENALQEAYDTIKHLQSVINEVNLLNAKLLFTNKLFRNFDLNESQKMKVIENFDRAVSTREVKLVFSTLAESFKRPTNSKRVVKESYASKATATTAPSKETTKVLNEGTELASRWKKLAGLV